MTSKNLPSLVKTNVYMTPSEILEYKGYLKLIEEARTVIEVNTYYAKAQKLVEKALTRQKSQ